MGLPGDITAECCNVLMLVAGSDDEARESRCGCNMGSKGGSESGSHLISKELMTWRGATTSERGPGKECGLLSTTAHATAGIMKMRRGATSWGAVQGKE